MSESRLPFVDRSPGHSRLPGIPVERERDVKNPGPIILRYRQLRASEPAAQRDVKGNLAESNTVGVGRRGTNAQPGQAAPTGLGGPMRKGGFLLPASTSKQRSENDNTPILSHPPKAPLFSDKRQGSPAPALQSNAASLDSALQRLRLSAPVEAWADPPVMNSGVRSVHFDVSRSRPQRSHPPLRYAPMPPAPSLPAAAGADVVSKGTEQPSDASMHMGPVRHEHAIRSRAEKVVWFASEGPPLTAVALPPTIANVGDVYVHKTLGSVQIWLRAASGTWLPIAEQHPHPIITGYVLRLLENGDPRWVTKETFRTYVGRQKKLEQSAYLS